MHKPRTDDYGHAAGQRRLGSQRDALAFEQAAIAEETALQALLVREKVEAARRAMLLYPQRPQLELVG